MGETSAIEWTDATGRRLGALKTAARRTGVAPEERAARIADGSKHCRICRAWRPVADFGRDASRGDGLTAARLPELRGKNLACFCKPGEPCHADILIELANRETAP
jgi:hypothetical protein